MERTISAKVRVPMRERRNNFFDNYPMEDVNISMKELGKKTGLSPRVLGEYVYSSARYDARKKNSYWKYVDKENTAVNLVAKKEGARLDGDENYWQRAAASEDIAGSSHETAQNAWENYKPSPAFWKAASAVAFGLWAAAYALVCSPVKDTKSYVIGVAIGLFVSAKIFLESVSAKNPRAEYEKAIVQLAFNIRAAVLDAADGWNDEKRNAQRM